MKGTSVSNSKSCSVASTKTTNSSASKYSLLRASNGRSIHHSLASIQRKVKRFKRKHLVSKAKIDYSACATCLQSDVLPEWGMSNAQIGTYDKFLALTLRKPLDEEIVSSNQFIDLLSLSERAQDFDSLLQEDRPKLSKILEQHVLNTCVSLKEEDNGSNLSEVSEYDQVVTEFKATISQKWEEMDSVITDYENNSTPFSVFVENGEALSSKMRQVCTLMLEVCKLTDEWVTEDEAYPAKLEQEMASTTASRDEIQLHIQQVHEKKAENLREVERLVKQEERAERQFYDVRKEKRKMKQRLQELEERKGHLKEMLGKKRQERDHLKKRLTDQGQTSSRDLFDLNAQMSQMETSIDKLEEQQRITTRQLKRCNKDIKPITDRTYEHKVEMVTIRHHKENLLRENCDLDIDLDTLQKRLVFVTGLIAKLKNIREQKLSGEAFRKNLRLRQRREVAYANGSHDFEEACKMAATGIGKDWKNVYFRLPFDPPRDPARLQRDVSVLDHIAYRSDIPPEGQALKCLEKWRTLNRKGDINELIKVLRDIKKKRLAAQLSNRFVPVAV